VGVEIDVVADAQLASVDAVPEHLSDTRRRHPKPTRQFDHASARNGGLERGGHFGRTAIRHKLSRVRVAVVANRRLATLPDTGLGRPAAQIVEPLDVLLALVLVDRGENVPLQPSAARAGVDALLGNDDLSAGLVHTVVGAQLLGEIAAEPGQVRDDDARVFAALDALDRTTKRRPLLERQAARHIELRRQNHDTITLGCRPFDRLNLVAVGVYVLRARLAHAHVADPYDTSPDSHRPIIGKQHPWHYGYTLNPRSTPRPAAEHPLPSFVPDRFAPMLARAAQRWNVSAALLAAQLYVESNFNPFVTSPAGAQGIAQFMPGTARALGLTDPFDAERAIDAQAHLMRDLLRRFASVPLALAAYNAGPGAVAPCMCVPPYPETRGYVARILGLLQGAGQLPAGAGLQVRLVK
jgi:hypothetical protein